MSPSQLLSRWLLPEAAGRWSVPPLARAVTRLAHLLEPAVSALGHAETRALRRRLSSDADDRPLFVVGIARAGTTITLEVLHHHPDVATHRYYHLPVPQLPYWSSRLIEALPLVAAGPVERIHADRLKITKDSPEMVEERLWTAHFPHLHSERESSVLDESTRNPRFERAYRDHLRKLCLAQGRPRYAAKNNNLVTRLPYLHRLFPQARFLIVVRRPLAHAASYLKQQRLFEGFCAEDPGLVRYLKIVGHFEFGPHQRFLHTGDGLALAEVRRCWDEGRRAAALGGYWASVYGHVADVLDARPELKEAALTVRYEDLCNRSAEILDRILEHTSLAAPPFAATRAHYVESLSEPDYYRHDFSDAEVAEIHRRTAAVAARYGY